MGYKKVFHLFFTDPVLLKTTTTRSPLPPWFPLTSPTPSFEKNRQNNSGIDILSPKNSSSLHESESSAGSIFELSPELSKTDCPDPEHNNCGNSHWVKVPKVPYDYDYIKNNSKPHFPYDLPGDNHEDDSMFYKQQYYMLIFFLNKLFHSRFYPSHCDSQCEPQSWGNVEISIVRAI